MKIDMPIQSTFNQLLINTPFAAHPTHEYTNSSLRVGFASLFLRSRYTRKERVGVCAAFVYLSMMLSAVWYDIAPEKPSTGGFFDLGAFSLSPEQVFVIAVIFGICKLLIYSRKYDSCFFLSFFSFCC